MAGGRNLRGAAREEGLGFARAWKVRQKPISDALFGIEPCRCCGRRQSGAGEA